MDSKPAAAFWFPGRWLGATGLVFGPLLLMAGILLRLEYHFFFPQQLAAFQENPALITASYSCFLAGNVLLWPAILTVAHLIGRSRPAWAVWGGSLVLFGLFARTFHAGVDHLAFQLVRMEGLGAATKVIAGSYGAFHVMAALNLTILAGWIVLAVGAYLSRMLSAWRSVALAMMAGLMIGVLKGSSVMSVVWVAGLCVAFVPLGVEVLLQPPKPRMRAALGWLVFLAASAAFLHLAGQLG